jgi:hypothetical protein
MAELKISCTNCNKRSRAWVLSNYFGISGSFCRDCYNKVSHNSYGQPENPAEYICVLLKQKARVAQDE